MDRPGNIWLSYLARLLEQQELCFESKSFVVKRLRNLRSFEPVFLSTLAPMFNQLNFAQKYATQRTRSVLSPWRQNLSGGCQCPPRGPVAAKVTKHFDSKQSSCCSSKRAR